MLLPFNSLPAVPLPHLTGEPRQAKLRPPWLKWVVLWSVAESILSLVLFVLYGKHNPARVVGEIFAKVLGACVLWSLWRGRPWARYLMLLGAGLSLLGLAFFARENWLLRSSNGLSLITGVFLLWWLNTKSVAVFFRSKGEAVSAAPLEAS